MTDVACVEPSILEHRGSRFRLTVITAHHIWPTDEDLAVVSDLDLNPLEGYSDRSDVIVAGSIRGNNARLCRSVTLEDGYPGSEIRVRQRRRKRSAAGNEVS